MRGWCGWWRAVKPSVAELLVGHVDVGLGWRATSSTGSRERARVPPGSARGTDVLRIWGTRFLNMGNFGQPPQLPRSRPTREHPIVSNSHTHNNSSTHTASQRHTPSKNQRSAVNDSNTPTANKHPSRSTTRAMTRNHSKGGSGRCNDTSGREGSDRTGTAGTTPRHSPPNSSARHPTPDPQLGKQCAAVRNKHSQTHDHRQRRHIRTLDDPRRQPQKRQTNPNRRQPTPNPPTTSQHVRS